MNDEQLTRYSRHILLPQIDFAGQEKLLHSRVLVVGMGGLGSPLGMYLASSGVGHIVICDDDRVDLSNLQRQIIHRTADIGRNKVDSACDTMLAINPGIEISVVRARLAGEALAGQVRLADVVVDACDNFATRFALNEACVAEARPLVSGSVIRTEGQVTVFRADRPGGPCYRCLYKESEEAAESCAESGVLAPVAGIIASIQAVETLKILLDAGDTLAGRLLLLDALAMTWRTVRLARDPACPVCSLRSG
ncbi:MAG: HesA/MoeB/ThiF family protein [Pseudomonadota bacterium]